MCKDDDGNPKDVLQFFTEGYGFVVRQNKANIPFLYKAANSQVMIAANNKGVFTSMVFTRPEEHNRLTLKNDITGSESFYVRESDEKKFSCK